MMARQRWEDLVTETVLRHVKKLRELVADNKLSVEEHNTIGHMLQRNIGYLAVLSDYGWTTFKELVDETRRVQALDHEQDPKEHHSES